MAEQLVFNDALNLLGSLGTGVTTLGGTADVTYGPANTVGGSLSLTAAGLLGAQTYTNLAVTQTGTAADGVTPIYTLTGSNTLTSVSIVYTGQAPTTMNATVTLLSTGVAVASGSGNVAASIVCFVSGTQIRTVRGDLAVEHLAVGDLAVTASGAHRPIRWLAYRTVDCRRHPRPQDVMPVRIAAHALGADMPSRDLYVSPGHSICVDLLGEVLMPASSLVNGTTIRQVEADEVTYWHVELDSHDILLAENLPAESYFDMGNRGFFAQSPVVDLDAAPDAPLRTHADFCRPYHDAGPLVDAVRMQLETRASALGWRLDGGQSSVDLHLLVDGLRIEPVTRGLVARFAVPAAARNVWLVSTTARPCEIAPDSDGRDLGVCVTDLTIEDGFAPPHRIDLADPLLCVGFHPLEQGLWRWTAGRARLPEVLWQDAPDGFFLCVHLGGPALPRWVAPADAPSHIQARRETPRLALVAGNA